VASRIYLDYATNTPVDRRVLSVFTKTARIVGNPSSIHAEGVAVKKILEDARTRVARALHAHVDEVRFTQSATYALSALIHGCVASYTQEHGTAPHIVSTSIEHSAVLETLKKLEAKGKITLTCIDPEHDGRVLVSKVMDAVTEQTLLVICMQVNNETGAIEPVAKIGKEIRKLKSANEELRQYPYLLVDSSQAPGFVAVTQDDLCADLVVIDAHKIYGLAGSAALYIRRGVKCEAHHEGGGQEYGLFSGTESVAHAQALALALERAVSRREKRYAKVASIKKYCEDEIKKTILDVVVNGDSETASPHILNISLPGVDTEYLVLWLDARGVALSTKSACAHAKRVSHVVYAITKDTNRAGSTLRISFSEDTSKRHINTLVRLLKEFITSRGIVVG
jgi:cysteine desulfurase